MPPKALIVWGGWDGHQPRQVAELFARVLREDGFEVTASDTLDAFATHDLKSLALIVPVWTMGKISSDQLRPVLDAVRSAGVGIAGCHGGMCDAFRDATEWHFMTGGQWVAHPGNDGVRHTIQITPAGQSHPITRDIPDFEVATEQYYMHTDPAVKVLATTKFPIADGPHTPNGPVDMPVIWTKFYGKGKVFYDSLGHSAAIVKSEPNLTLMRRGFHWAARSS